MFNKYFLDTEDNCIVAFIDILGFSSLIFRNETTRDTDEGSLVSLSSTITHLS
jgi:hypothetical protein